MGEAQSQHLAKQIAHQIGAYLCVDCGKCTSSCPVGQAGAIYSPRALVQHLLLDSRDPLEEEIWRCLTCGQCKERCPSDVDYPRLIYLLREIAYDRGLKPNETHGGTIHELMSIMTNQKIRQRKMGWLPDWVEAVDGDTKKSNSKDFYFVGCAPYFDIIFESFKLDLLETHVAGLELLKLSGVTPSVITDERCCGHDALWSGNKGIFLDLARRNLDLFARVGAKRVFVSCPEGYYTFTKEYTRHFGDLGIEFVNTVRFLAERMEEKIPSNGRVAITYHDSCRMGRFSGLYDEPRKILGLVEGVELAEMTFPREHAPCCGSSLWINCDEISKRMQLNLLSEAEHTGAELLITPCDKCRIHLACAQMEMGSVAAKVKTDNILRFLYRKGVRKS